MPESITVRRQLEALSRTRRCEERLDRAADIFTGVLLAAMFLFSMFTLMVVACAWFG